MARSWKRWAGRAAFVAVAAAALVNAGCLVAAVGAAAGAAGAAGYYYYTAPLVHDYPSPYGDTLTAVKAALAELQFPIVKEQPVGGGTLIETHTGDGVAVQVALDLVTSPVPADGSLTRLSVRVGHFGDEPSARASRTRSPSTCRRRRRRWRGRPRRRRWKRRRRRSRP